MPKARRITAAAVAAALLVPATGMASSHREAPQITETPKVDATDLYAFRSYESGREGFVTIIANYLPLQDAYGGPNYFSLDPNALYEIHIDNDGDAVEDLTFQFRFDDTYKDLALNIGDEGDTRSVAVPLKNIGGIGPGPMDTGALNVEETFSITMVEGDRRSGSRSDVLNLANQSDTFRKPVDNIGNKSIADYESYANAHIWDISVPGCSPGKVFVGQRKEGFAVNLGEVFDLVNTNPVGPADGESNTLANKNITSLALELPIDCITADDSVVGVWTTASLRQARILNPEPESPATAAVHGGAWTQVSRLGAPLVNEVVIGLPDKDRFNASEPQNDGQFLDYVTHPALPELLEILFGVQAPNAFPRNDLIAVFLTGVADLNQPANVTASEQLRLNTAIAPKAPAEQSNLGVLGGDTAGFPNGRRPGDDVVDIALRAAMGVLLDSTAAPDGQLPYTDGATVSATEFSDSFPYLVTPIPGSPSDAQMAQMR